MSTESSENIINVLVPSRERPGWTADDPVYLLEVAPNIHGQYGFGDEGQALAFAAALNEIWARLNGSDFDIADVFEWDDAKDLASDEMFGD